MGTGTLRADDADRETTLVRLKDAFTEGALDQQEYDRRLGLAVTATFRSDLDPLTADLPVSRAALVREEDARKVSTQEADRRAWRKEWGYWGSGVLIMTTIWGATGLAHGRLTFYWPVVPLAIWAVVLITYAIWPSDKAEKPSA